MFKLYGTPQRASSCPLGYLPGFDLSDAVLTAPTADTFVALSRARCFQHRWPNAITSPERTLVYWPNLPRDSTPVVAGWSFSALVILPQPVSSWTYVPDHLRVSSTET